VLVTTYSIFAVSSVGIINLMILTFAIGIAGMATSYLISKSLNDEYRKYYFSNLEYRVGRHTSVIYILLILGIVGLLLQPRVNPFATPLTELHIFGDRLLALSFGLVLLIVFQSYSTTWDVHTEVELSFLIKHLADWLRKKDVRLKEWKKTIMTDFPFSFNKAVNQVRSDVVRNSLYFVYGSIPSIPDIDFENALDDFLYAHAIATSRNKRTLEKKFYGLHQKVDSNDANGYLRKWDEIKGGLPERSLKPDTSPLLDAQEKRHRLTKISIIITISFGVISWLIQPQLMLFWLGILGEQLATAIGPIDAWFLFIILLFLMLIIVLAIDDLELMGLSSFITCVDSEFENRK
jgi:hypothetical protein